MPTIHQRSGWAPQILSPGSVSPTLASQVRGLEIIWEKGPPQGRVCVRSEKVSWPGGSSCMEKPLSSLKLLSTGQTFVFGNAVESEYCSYCSSSQNIPIVVSGNNVVYQDIILK